LVLSVLDLVDTHNTTSESNRIEVIFIFSFIIKSLNLSKYHSADKIKF